MWTNDGKKAEIRYQGVTLEVGGTPGTKFSGTCSVGSEQNTIGGQVPARHVYEPGGDKLESEIRKREPVPRRSSSPPGTTYAPCNGPTPREAP